MDETRIRQILVELESIPLENTPRSEFLTSHPPGYVFLEANPEGCLSFARAMLEASLSAKPTERPATIQLPEPHQQVRNGPESLILGYISVAPDLPRLTQAQQQVVRVPGLLQNVGCLLGAISLIFLLISGFLFWVALACDLLR